MIMSTRSLRIDRREMLGRFFLLALHPRIPAGGKLALSIDRASSAFRKCIYWSMAYYGLPNVSFDALASFGQSQPA
jgi:hypothetical protein